MNATLKTNGVETVHELPKRSLLDEIVDENRIAGARYMPVMTPKTAKLRSVALQELKDLCLIEDEDYGVIPGTGTKEKPAKPVLLKPGAEKICAYFGYVPHYEIMAGSIEDWSGKLHGEPLFYYHVRCSLMRDGVAVGEGTGSCSSWERKYRYRSSKRTCPSCGSQSLIKGKPDFERDAEYKKRGAWICYEKKGGCGAKYFGDDPEIMDQPLGDVPNPDVADIINTVQKMADKRSYVASVLSATGASQWFTQDLEPEDDSAAVSAKYGVQPGTAEASAKVADAKIAEGKAQAPPPDPDAWRKGFLEIAMKAFDSMGDSEFNGVVKSLGYDTIDKVATPAAGKAVVEALRARMRALKAQAAAAPTPEPPKSDSAPFEATDDDLPAELASTSSSPTPASDDQVSLAEVRNKITAHKTKLGIARYGEILAQFNLNSPFAIQNVFQGEDVLRAMKEALPAKV